MIREGCCRSTAVLILLFVFVLILVLILILILAPVLLIVLVLILVILVLILVLIIHDSTSLSFSRLCRSGSLPRKSGFILRFENQTGQQTRANGCGNAAGCGCKSACENTQEAVFIHRFPYAFG